MKYLTDQDRPRPRRHCVISQEMPSRSEWDPPRPTAARSEIPVGEHLLPVSEAFFIFALGTGRDDFRSRRDRKSPLGEDFYEFGRRSRVSSSYREKMKKVSPRVRFSVARTDVAGSPRRVGEQAT